jgi:hypothetical protein
MAKQRPFNDILNECYDRMAEGQTLEYCLQIFPDEATELQPLLEIKANFDAFAEVKPDAEFKTRAYYQMQNALDSAWDKAPRRAGFRWQPRLAMIAVSVIGFIIVAGGGTVFGAGGAMPDGTLYPVKLFAEQARVSLTGDETAKAELYASLTERRVTEISYLAGNQGSPEQVSSVLAELDGLLADASLVPLPGDAASMGGQRSWQLFSAPGEPSPVPAPTTTPTASPAPRAPAAMTDPEPNTASEPTTEKATSPPPTEAMTTEAPMAAVITADGGQVPNLTPEQLEVISTLDLNRTELIARLTALLETAPVSLRPLIRQAILSLDSGYNSAINNWALPQDNN